MERNNFYRFAEITDEDDARSKTVMRFTFNYVNFFNPEDISKREKPEEQVLSGFSVLVDSEGLKSILYDHEGVEIRLPYGNLDERFSEIMERDRDPELYHQPEEETLELIPDLEGLPDNLKNYPKTPVLILRKFFILNPDGEMNRSVERLIFYIPPNGQNPKEEIGEIWLGKKWKSQTEEVLPEVIKEHLIMN